MSVEDIIAALGSAYDYDHEVTEIFLGQCCVAQCIETKESVLVKASFKDKQASIDKFEIYDNTRAEIAMMKEFKGVPHFIQLLDVLETDKVLCIVMPYLHHGDMMNYLMEMDKPLAENETKVIMNQLLNVLKMIHERGFAYLDLSLENILIESIGSEAEPEKWRICLIDLNMFVRNDAHKDTKAFEAKFGKGYYPGKPVVQAPEIIVRCRLNSKFQPWDPTEAQIWPLGVILYTLHVNSLPYDEFNDLSFKRILSGIWVVTEKLSGVPTPWCHTSNAFRCLVDSMLKLPDKRIKFADVLKHPWFTLKKDAETLPLPSS